MREHVVKLYAFDELSESAKTHATEAVMEMMYQFDITDDIQMMFEYELGKMGMPTDSIAWGLSYRQGDGMAFYGIIDTKKMFDADPTLLMHLPLLTAASLSDTDFPLRIGTTKNSWGNHYAHWNTMTVDVDWDDEEIPALNTEADKLTMRVDELVKSISRRLETKGYELIENMTGEEAATDFIENNMSEDFTETGTIY